MNLLSSIVTGSAASLAISLFLRPLWTFISRRSTQGTLLWHPANLRTEVAYLTAHALAGMTQGALFWMSWGFAALVSIPWWLRGLSVGAGYTLLVLPLLLIGAAVLRVHKAVWLVLLSEALFTNIAVGLACSWNWAHSP